MADTSLDARLIDIITAPIPMADLREEISEGIIEAITESVEGLSRDRLTGNSFRPALHITIRDVLTGAHAYVSRLRGHTDDEHRAYLESVLVALAAALASEPVSAS